MSAPSILKNVAIAGATGNLGSHFVEELVKTGRHSITALTRSGSQAKIANGVKVAEVDYSDQPALIKALEGQDFLAIVLGAAAPPETHTQIVEAAAKAGVRYTMPTTYGADITNESMIKDELYHQGAVAKVKELEGLGLNHITMACGFWHEISLSHGDLSFGIDIKGRRATLFDDGTAKIATSTLRQCGRAFAALLALPESGASPSLADWKNKPLRFASFRVSQRDMLDSIQRVTGTTDADWEVAHEASAKRVADGLAGLQAGDYTGFVKAMYARAFYPSAEADFEAGAEVCNDVLGLPEEDLDETSKWLVEKIESGWQPYA